MDSRFSGKFIVLDGPDGCGKTTQAERLAQWFQQQGVAVEIFRDPGATAIGEKIRQILLNPEHIAMNTATEALLYMASRAQLWAQEIAPALRAGKCVVVDRWLSSTCAYQGYAGGFGMDKVIKIATDFLERPWPDLTVILDVEVEAGSARLTSQPDRMEQKGNLYHQKVREGFLRLAQHRKDFAVVDANEDIETVHKKIIEITEEMFL